MKIADHRILGYTQVQGTPNGRVGASLTALPRDTFEASVPADPNLPDLSGLAKFSRTRSVAVRDSKLESENKRVLLLDNSTGAVQELDVDWSKTGRARDLEAIAKGKGQGDYLAVEGSSFGDNRARLFDLKLTAQGGESRRSFELPDFGQEIEGLVSLPQKDGSQRLLFGGRGDESGAGRIYWGTLNDQGLSFTPEGLEGTKVVGPSLGKGQRSIAELALNDKGELWGTAAVDDGDYGPFKSAIYRIGTVNPEGATPVQVDQTKPHALINGTKAEAFTFLSRNRALLGSDNEAFGGRLESFRLLDQTV